MTALLAGSPALAPANAQSGDFQACLQTIKADAVRQGVPAEVAAWPKSTAGAAA